LRKNSSVAVEVLGFDGYLNRHDISSYTETAGMKVVAHVATLTLYLAAPCFSMPCEPKEYAEYKNQAVTAYGRRSMATEYCQSQIRYKAAMELADSENKYGRVRGAKEALSDASSCRAELSKIKDAFMAAKADDALAYINRDCKGDLGR
jgi:hypothetical protein